MSLNQATSSKISQWFKNHLQPQGIEPAVDATSDIATPDLTTTTAPTTGLLASADVAPEKPATGLLASGSTPKNLDTGVAASATTNPIGRGPTPPVIPVTPGSDPTNPVSRDGPAPILDTVPPKPAPPPVPELAPATPAPATPAPAAPAPAPGAKPGANADGTSTDKAKPPGSVTTLDLDELSRREVSMEELVEERMRGLLADDSDYLKGFRERAAREANRRGLLNSTMAVTGGEAAAAEAALPIATADAEAYTKAAEYNAAVENQARMFNADAWNRMSLEQQNLEVQKQIAADNRAASMAASANSAASARYSAELSAASSRYATDTGARERAADRAEARYQAEQDRIAALERQNQASHDNRVTNILLNNDVPARIRAQQLRALGEDALAHAMMIAEDEDDTESHDDDAYIDPGSGG